MRLYPLAGDVPAVDDAEFGHFEPADDGGFDLPGPLASRLHGAHVAGQKQWETSIERQQREISAELARRQSPEALYEAVQQLVQSAQTVQAPSAKTEAPARPPARRGPAAK